MNDNFDGSLIEISRKLVGALALIFGFLGLYQEAVNEDSTVALVMWLLCGICALIFIFAYRKHDKQVEDEETKQKKNRSDAYLQKINDKKQEICKEMKVDKFIIYEALLREYSNAEESIVVGFDFNNKTMGGCKYVIVNIINLASVYNVEIMYNTTFTTSTSTENKGALGRAAVGGLIGGGVGAIIGAATAKQESHSYTTAREDFVGIRFYSRDAQNPHYEIECKDKKFITDIYTTVMALIQ